MSLYQHTATGEIRDFDPEELAGHPKAYLWVAYTPPPPPPPTAEETRLAEIDATIAEDGTLASLKGMTNAQFDTWWTNNVTNNAQRDAVLKRLARVVLRRVL